MRKFYLTTLLVVAGMAVFAQEKCGFDAIHEKLMQTDPQYAATINANNDYIRKYIAEHPPTASRTNAALYTIPVVVHVVHTGGGIGTIYNPDDATIIGAINYLNSIYDGTEATLYGGVGDIQIQFALAQRDPDCNPTNGINHVDGSGVPNYTALGVNRNNSNGATEISVKNLIRWDPANYYNIWVINKIDGLDGTSGSFIAGFAYFPGSASSLDGTMMLATQMKTGAKTLPHEIGHALNLYHTFQGSNNGTCPVNNSCSFDGDMVCDTDPVPSHTNFACRQGTTNGCTGTLFNDNTENNFMGYTNCYTLFTAGQKTRALAAMNLPSRASLANSLAATPTYSGAVQCAPKINFENNGMAVTETTVGTVDCRKYKDYTVNMTIASNPTAVTTVTLQLSGTATNVDYQVTTNGNFNAPSLQLTFPAGSHANQSFMIRVLDNAIVDGARTVYVDYTVNNGGGNALKGSANTLYTVTINDNDFVPQPYNVVNASVGSGNTSFNQPFRGEYQQSRTQALYLASELTSAGLSGGSKITSISFNVLSKSSSTPFTGFSIGMGHSATTGLSTGAFESGISNVYSGDYSTVPVTNTITLNTPFVWDGTSNLVVEFCYGKAGVSATSDNIMGTVTASSMCIWNRTATGVGCSLSPGFNSISGTGFVRPNLTFNAQSGNAVATTLNTTQSEYFGPNADIYFINNEKVIGRIRNLTAFDYGCTSFKIDRAGNSSSNFWNTTTGNNVTNKTFIATPANATGSGQVEVTLYYTAAEKTGYETSTGKSWNTISMIKTPLAVSATNSGTASPWWITVQPSVTRSSFGSDFTLKGSFTGNLGGFTAGDPAAVLPLRWVSFTGKITKEFNAELLWSTANEINTSHFDVEESGNGLEFRKIGTAKAAGTGNNDYSFVHIKPSAGSHYYRIKQYDKDGRFTYSTTVLLILDNKYDIFAYPIPAIDKLSIRFGKAAQNPVIEILSADMKLLKREVLTGIVYDKEIGVSELAPGVYIARIIVDGKPQVLRFIKQ